MIKPDPNTTATQIQVEVQDKSVEANIKEDIVQPVQELKEKLKLTELEQDARIVEDAPTGQHKALCEELAEKDEKIVDMEQEIRALETALRDHSHMTELEELVGVVHQKDERIEELEEALRESVRITAEQEMVVMQGELRRKQMMEKVSHFSILNFCECCSEPNCATSKL